MKTLELKHLYENYIVRNNGDVFSIPRKGTKGGLLKPFITKGYYRVSIWENGILKQKQIHRLVAETYLDNPENKPQVNHIDGNKLNNDVENLEWATAQENSQHSYDIGLSTSPAKGKFGYESSTGKEVHQYTKQYVFIKSYGSIRQASRETGVNVGNISQCINQFLNTAGGFIWKS